MARHYGVLFHDYWEGPTGREIADRGGVDALLLGIYLTANRQDNMIGLYRMPIEDVKLPMPRARMVAALLALQDAGFALYDFATSFVWVREMARIRVGLQHRDAALAATDNRIQFVNTLYQRIEDNPFLLPFFKRYAHALHLTRRRTSTLSHRATPGRNDGGATKGLRRPSKASKQISKQIRSETDQRSESRSGDRA